MDYGCMLRQGTRADKHPCGNVSTARGGTGGASPPTPRAGTRFSPQSRRVQTPAGTQAACKLRGSRRHSPVRKLHPNGQETSRPVDGYFFLAGTGPGTLDGVTVEVDGTATGFFGCLGFLSSRLLRC